MIGADAPRAANELVVKLLPGGQTRLSVTITDVSTELRDVVLGTGMMQGMEATYACLESAIAGA